MPPPVRAAAGLGIDYRSAIESDLPFLSALYASTRADELSGLGWPPEMLKAFLDQQFQAQHRHFRAVYPDGEWLIVEHEATPIGRLYLNESADEVHLIDIALIEGRRGQGVGGALVGDLIYQAHGLGKAVTCHVENRNLGAARLYARLGFERIEDDGLYAKLRYAPPSSD